MLHEYAVEPNCFENGQNFRYLTENFGVSEGRLISMFPKKWWSCFIEVVENSPDGWVKGRQLEQSLEYLKKHATIRSGRNYVPSLSWVENAVLQQSGKNPFHAVVVRDASGYPDFVIGADRLDKNNPRWKLRREKRVLRTATELGNEVSLLLRMSKQIFFVDKIFASQLDSSDGSDKKRWLSTLSHFIQIATKDRDVLPEFEYHSELKVLSDRAKEKFEENCRRDLHPVLTTGSSLTLIAWTKWSDEKDFFHARYILTERGGIRIDWGLDQGKNGEKTEQKTDVSLLDHDMWDELWRLFQPEARTFQKLPYDVVVTN